MAVKRTITRHRVQWSVRAGLAGASPVSRTRDNSPQVHAGGPAPASFLFVGCDKPRHRATARHHSTRKIGRMYRLAGPSQGGGAPSVLAMARKKRLRWFLKGGGGLIEPSQRVAKRKRKSTPSHLFAQSQGDVARILGMSRKHLQEQLSRGCPGKTEKGYDLWAIGSWFRRNSDRFLVRQTPDNESMRWDARARKAEAQIKELRLNEKLATWVTKSDVRRAANKAFTVLTGILDGGLPEKCAALVSTEFREEVSLVVKTTVENALGITAQALGRCGSDNDPVVDDLASLRSVLEQLPGQLSGVMKTSAQRTAVRKACEAWLSDTRRALEERFDRHAKQEKTK